MIRYLIDFLLIVLFAILCTVFGVAAMIAAVVACGVYVILGLLGVVIGLDT